MDKLAELLEQKKLAAQARLERIKEADEQAKVENLVQLAKLKAKLCANQK